MRISIAGASGFVGSHLLRALPHPFQVKALSRQERKYEEDHITSQVVDLFSLSSTINALKDTDIAVYLVHSMIPATRMFQGDFCDTDLILADNFAKACVKNNVKQIVYLSGVCPEGKPSKHLKSRLEVEEVFNATNIPTTVIRAGMIVGNGGSSFEILKNLIINLPAMILPRWTQSLTQVVHIDDLVTILTYCFANKDEYGKTINAVTGEILTYEGLIRKTAKYLGKRLPAFSVPINSTSFSKLWVTLFGEANHQLVSPLVESLTCNIGAIKQTEGIDDLLKYKNYDSMLETINRKKIKKKVSLRKQFKDTKSVRSIQRLSNPQKLTAYDISLLYMKWLPLYLKVLVNVSHDEKFIYFNILNTKLCLLKLELIRDEQDYKRQKFHIVGGFLCGATDKGWLEFRSVANDQYLIASINNFIPALPWSIYKITQAPVHKFVMGRFNNYLAVQVDD